MGLIHCPLCNGPLEQRRVAPCFDCGGNPDELEELANGEHEYFVYEIWGHEIVLCDFCDADFDSYSPKTFGLSQAGGGDYPLAQVGKIESPVESEDLYCQRCQWRLAFLEFVASVRRGEHGGET